MKFEFKADSGLPMRIVVKEKSKEKAIEKWKLFMQKVFPKMVKKKGYPKYKIRD